MKYSNIERFVYWREWVSVEILKLGSQFVGGWIDEWNMDGWMMVGENGLKASVQFGYAALERTSQYWGASNMVDLENLQGW